MPCAALGQPTPNIYWVVASAHPSSVRSSIHFNHQSSDHQLLSHSSSSGSFELLDGTWTSASTHSTSTFRYVRADGSLVFTPFFASEYQDAIHNRRYRCVAVNSHGAIMSREVHIKARKFF